MTAHLEVDIREHPTGSGATCRAILETLPAWFGIAEANDDYVVDAERRPAVIASVEGRDVGILVIHHHSPFAAEVHLMAVVPEFHRRRIGGRMLGHAEDALARAGVEFLQVKTLSASSPDEGYAKTRAFYAAYGFRELEEFPDLWDPANPALQMIKSVRPQLSS